jgi:hypothetical protein
MNRALLTLELRHVAAPYGLAGGLFLAYALAYPNPLFWHNPGLILLGLFKGRSWARGFSRCRADGNRTSRRWALHGNAYFGSAGAPAFSCKFSRSQRPGCYRSRDCAWPCMNRICRIIP